MAPLRGWGTRGERLITHVPHGHWQTMTFIGALRHDRIEAPWVLDGPVNAEAFKTYVKAELLKTLKPDDIVVLDNSPQSQGQGGARHGQSNRRQAVLPAVLQSRSQPNRAGLRKNQARDAKGDGPKRRGRRKRRRQNSRHHYTTGMRELPGKCRIQVNLNATRSRLKINLDLVVLLDLGGSSDGRADDVGEVDRSALGGKRP